MSHSCLCLFRLRVSNQSFEACNHHHAILGERVGCHGGFGRTIAEDVIEHRLVSYLLKITEETPPFNDYIESNYAQWLQATNRSRKKASPSSSSLNEPDAARLTHDDSDEIEEDVLNLDISPLASTNAISENNSRPEDRARLSSSLLRREPTTPMRFPLPSTLAPTTASLIPDKLDDDSYFEHDELRTFEFEQDRLGDAVASAESGSMEILIASPASNPQKETTIPMQQPISLPSFNMPILPQRSQANNVRSASNHGAVSSTDNFSDGNGIGQFGSPSQQGTYGPYSYVCSNVNRVIESIFSFLTLQVCLE